jgi:hypothetical protein
MSNLIYIRLDVDNVGDAIELALNCANFERANKIHLNIQREISKVKETLLLDNANILMIGSDDIMFSIYSNDMIGNLLSDICDYFKTNTGFTLSIGVGHNIFQALNNLKLAKLSGKNKIVYFNELVNYD